MIGAITRDDLAFGAPAARRAILIAFSLASAPPRVKNTRPPAKPERSSRRSASSARLSRPRRY